MSKNLRNDQDDNSPIASIRCEPIVESDWRLKGVEVFGIPKACVDHNITPDAYFDALARSPEKSMQYDLALMRKIGQERKTIPGLGWPGFITTMNVSYASLLDKEAANQLARAQIQAGFRFHDITPEIAEPRLQYLDHNKAQVNRETQRLVASGISVIMDDVQPHNDPRLIRSFIQASASRKPGRAKVLGCKFDHNLTHEFLYRGRINSRDFMGTLGSLGPTQIAVFEGLPDDEAAMLCLKKMLGKVSSCMAVFQKRELGIPISQSTQNRVWTPHGHLANAFGA